MTTFKKKSIPTTFIFKNRSRCLFVTPTWVTIAQGTDKLFISTMQKPTNQNNKTGLAEALVDLETLVTQRHLIPLGASCWEKGPHCSIYCSISAFENLLVS